jgi:hypothetical protein
MAFRLKLIPRDKALLEKLLKGKAVPVTGREGPYGGETLRFPHFLDNRLTDGGEVVRHAPATLYPPGRFLVLISVRGY